MRSKSIPWQAWHRNLGMPSLVTLLWLPNIPWHLQFCEIHHPNSRCCLISWVCFLIMRSEQANKNNLSRHSCTFWHMLFCRFLNQDPFQTYLYVHHVGSFRPTFCIDPRHSWSPRSHIQQDTNGSMPKYKKRIGCMDWFRAWILHKPREP